MIKDKLINIIINSNKIAHSLFRFVQSRKIKLIETTRLAMLHTPLVSITRACNATCLMCPRNAQKNMTSVHMDDRTLRKIIDCFKQHRWYDVPIHSMGECLLHPRFGEYVDILKSEGFRVHISTNAFLLDKWMDTLLKVDSLRYSIEGWDQASLKKYRGIGFDRVQSNIREFWKYSRNKIRYPITTLMCLHRTMTRQNIEQFVATWGPWVDEMNLGIAYNPYYNHVTNKITAPLQGENSPDPLQREFLPLIRKNNPYCPFPFMFPTIFPNGDVTVCCNDYQNVLIMGNIHETALRDIFYSPRYKELRNEFRSGNTSTCNNCYQLYDIDEASRAFFDECSAIMKDGFAKIKHP